MFIDITKKRTRYQILYLLRKKLGLKFQNNTKIILQFIKNKDQAEIIIKEMNVMIKKGRKPLDKYSEIKKIMKIMGNAIQPEKKRWRVIDQRAVESITEILKNIYNLKIKNTLSKYGYPTYQKVIKAYENEKNVQLRYDIKKRAKIDFSDQFNEKNFKKHTGKYSYLTYQKAVIAYNNEKNPTTRRQIKVRAKIEFSDQFNEKNFKKYISKYKYSTYQKAVIAYNNEKNQMTRSQIKVRAKIEFSDQFNATDFIPLRQGRPYGRKKDCINVY